MDVKRYLRGPFVWVALVIIAVLLISSISSAAGGFKKVDTEVALKAIRGDLLPTARADTVAALIHTPDRCLHLRQQILGVAP